MRGSRKGIKGAELYLFCNGEEKCGKVGLVRPSRFTAFILLNYRLQEYFSLP